MDGSRECHTEKNKSDREETPYDVPSMWNLKRNDTNELTYKTNKPTDLENELILCQRDEWMEGIVTEFGMDMYTLLYLK